MKDLIRYVDSTQDVEIMSTGQWAGRTWTSGDLQEMAANFRALLPLGIKPPVKLGHDDNQILAGQTDGQPALGWISNLQVKNDKLVATIRNIPEVLGGLIDKGRYKRVSSEIYPLWEHTPAEKNLKSGVSGKVISAIAFLGADIPEVKTLEDLGRLLHTEMTIEPTPAGAIAVPSKLSSYAAGSVFAWEEAVREAVNTFHGYNGYVVDLFGDRVVVNVAGDLFQQALTNTDGTIQLGPLEEVQVSYNPVGSGTQLDSSGNPVPMSAAALPARTNPPTVNEDGPKGPKEKADMTEQEVQELLKKSAAESEARMKAETDKAVADAIKATEDKNKSVIDSLRASLSSADERIRAAESRAQESDVDQFIRSRQSSDNCRLTQAQVPALKVLLMAVAKQTDVVLAAEEAKALKLGERDLTLRDLITAFVDAAPNRKALALTQSRVEQAPEEETRESLREKKLEEIASKHKLDLSEHADKSKAYGILAKQAPELLPHYGTPRQVA